MLAIDEITTVIETTRDDFFRDLAKIIEVPSVEGNPASGEPFGPEPRRVLDVLVELATSYGFTAHVVNDAMAVVEYGPSSDDYIGIVGHLDVVEAGTGWTSDPWTLTKKGERWYGRGVLDNKGPAFTTLWGLKLLKDHGWQPKHAFRLIFGSNEESGSGDIKLYLASEPAPMYGWTPDGKFPTVYGERGIVNYAIETPISDGSLDDLQEIVGEMGRAFVPDDISLIMNGETVHATGERVPSNAPEMGENALTGALAEANELGLAHGELAAYLKWAAESLHHQHYGEALGLHFSDSDSGQTIITPYSLELLPGKLRFEIAIRYPVTITEDQITAGLRQHIPANSQLTVIRSMPGILRDKNAPFIQLLSKVYEENTGLDGTPVTTTGATYARKMPNIIAFGPSFPGQKGIAHKADEWMNEKDLLLNMQIHMDAMQKIDTME